MVAMHKCRFSRLRSLLLGAVLLCASACGGSEPGSDTPSADAEAQPKKITLVLAAYTTAREAYGKAVLPAFQKSWKALHGQEVEPSRARQRG